MYHPEASLYSSDSDDLEFLEIMNNSDKTVDLTGIYFGGTGFVYQFPANSAISPNKSLYLASNSGVFRLAYGFVPYGQFTRHLSNKSENLTLLDGFGNVIDNVNYCDSAPLSGADGNGYYLKLSDINLDNSLASNWEALKEVITQEPYVSVSTDKLFLRCQEGSRCTFNVASNIDWTISGSDAWLTISKASGFGNETIIVTAEKNPTANIRNATITIKATGLYDMTVIVTQIGSPTGIIDSGSDRIQIYPNPSSTTLFIEGLIPDTQATIYDLQGNLVLKKQLLKDNLDISTLASGVYVIKLETKTGSITRKIVKY